MCYAQSFSTVARTTVGTNVVGCKRLCVLTKNIIARCIELGASGGDGINCHQWVG